MAPKGLVERLANGETIICAEGYLMEFERRGYLQCGGFIPEVVIEKPALVTLLHEEFVHAGSDIVEAFTYYGHRPKLRAIGREDDLERLNRGALKLARKVADETNTLMAGDICTTGLFVPGDASTEELIKPMFKEQVEWAVEEGADYIIGETYTDLKEAMLALEAVKLYGKGMPAVITLNACVPDVTADGVPIPEACRQLEEAGAAVVGLNCGRGPKTLMPLIKEVRKACKGPIAALPVVFRTDEKHKTWYSLRDPDDNTHIYPEDVQCHMCKRSEIRAFAEEAKAAGVQYIGLCCGNASHYIREVAEVYGRKPPASVYSPDMSNNLHFAEDHHENEEKVKMMKHLRGEHK